MLLQLSAPARPKFEAVPHVGPNAYPPFSSSFFCMHVGPYTHLSPSPLPPLILHHSYVLPFLVAVLNKLGGGNSTWSWKTTMSTLKLFLASLYKNVELGMERHCYCDEGQHRLSWAQFSSPS